MTRRTWPSTHADESGGFVIWWLIGLAGVGMLMFALVADGSRVLAALSDTSDLAQVAARAAARHVDPHTGLLDAALAETAAHDELTAAGLTGDVHVDAAHVTVTAAATVELPLLAIVGVPHRTVTSTRTAQIISDPTGTP